MSIAAIIAWIRRLEALIYLLLGGGTSPAAVTTTVWWQDYVSGNDANPGTQAQPVKTFGEIRRRLQGNVLGTRPSLRVPVTINVVSDVPLNDFNDPLCALLDLNLGPGGALIIQPAVPIIKRSGTILAVPNAFARTPTGQQTVTSTGVANWSLDADLIIFDTKTQAVAWVLSGAGTGTISASRAAVSLAAPPYLGVGAAAIGATDPYEIIVPRKVYLGSGSTLSAGPTFGPTGTYATQAQCYRLHFVSQPTVPEPALIEASAQLSQKGPLSNVGATLFFNECLFDVIPTSQVGGLYFVNCGFINGGQFGCAPGDGTTNVLCGYGRDDLVFNGGVTVDQDYVGVGAGIFCPNNNELSNLIGNFGSYGDASSPIFVGSARVVLQAVFDVSAITYGSTTAGVVIEIEDGGMAIVTNTAANSFDFNISTFDLSGNSSFGFNQGTGAIVGPTTNTFAHFDAALGAGTGFGGFAFNPASGCYLITHT